MIPPGMPGYQADLGKDIDFDAAAAKDLLKQAGYADPAQFPQLHFKFGTTSANQARAEFIQAQLKQNLGVDIVLDSMESKAYQAAYKAKDYDLAWTGWGADYPDPQNFMTGLFGCNASNNKYNYCNKEFDAAAAKGDTGTDLTQRLQAYAQAQGILVSDTPVASPRRTTIRACRSSTRYRWQSTNAGRGRRPRWRSACGWSALVSPTRWPRAYGRCARQSRAHRQSGDSSGRA